MYVIYDKITLFIGVKSFYGNVLSTACQHQEPHL